MEVIDRGRCRNAEFIRRDLRWCQGNMQYVKLLNLENILPMSRFQLLWAISMFIGVPAWLLMIALLPLKVFDSDVAAFPKTSTAVAVRTCGPFATPVVLSDGSSGLVHTVRPDAVTRPVIRLLTDPFGASIPPREIDLSRTPGLSISSTRALVTAPV